MREFSKRELSVTVASMSDATVASMSDAPDACSPDALDVQMSAPVVAIDDDVLALMYT